MMPTTRRLTARTALLLATGFALPTVAQSAETLSLPHAIAAAVTKHPAAMAASLAAEAAGLRAEQAGRWDNPGFEVYQENFPGFQGNQWIFSVTQRIRLGGQRGRSVDLGRAQQQALDWDAEALRNALRLRVEQEYTAAFAQQERIEASSRMLVGARDLQRQLEARFERGDVSRYEVLRIEREVERLRADVDVLRAELDATAARLAHLTNLSEPEDGWRFEDPLAGQGSQSPTVASNGAPTSFDDDLEKRPEVLAAAAREQAAVLGEELARKEATPDLVLSGGYTRLDPGYDGFVWSATVAIPLFNRKQDEIAARQVEIAQRGRELDAVTLERRSRAAEAHARYVAATNSLEAGGSAGTGIAEIALTAYSHGEMTVMEVVDAMRADLEARSQTIEMARRRAAAWFEWTWATGTAARETSQ